MNQDEKDIIALKFRRFQQGREKIYQPKINKVLIAQYKTFIDYYDRDGIEAVNQISDEEMYDLLNTIYFDAAINYGAKTLDSFNKLKRVELKARHPMGFSERMNELIKKYFGVDILNTSRGITETTKNLIRQVFIGAYPKGLGINDIIKQFEDTELSRARSRLIARTETVTAANAGSFIVAKDTGLKSNKIWIATKDKRTRHDHDEVDGQTIPMDEYFKVGVSTMLVPGARVQEDGSAVPANEVCNCRCSTGYIALRDANGRLVRE